MIVNGTFPYIPFPNLHLFNTLSISKFKQICSGNRNNNIFVAPTDYIEANSSLMFIVNLFYHLSNGLSFKDSFAIASAIESETKLYNFYS